MRELSPVLLRLGIGAVIIWFSLQQVTDPATWVSFLPSWTGGLPISQVGFVYLNGWFELTFGLLMIAGFYTRIVAFFLGIHLLGIVYTLGYNSTGVRDFGLSVALIAISLHGMSRWSLDEYFANRQ